MPDEQATSWKQRSRGTIGNVEPWLEYRHQRDQASYAYDAAKAGGVFQLLNAS